jgi:UDP-galactose transporter B1
MLFSRGNSTSSAIKDAGSTASFMLTLSCMTNVIVSQILIWIERCISKSGSMNETRSRPLRHRYLMYGSLAYASAMMASNESLAYVSYPTAVLAKSSKLIPTMIAGLFVADKKLTTSEWISAILITGGITSFNLSRLSSKDQGDDTVYGIALLLFSLVMDGILATCQTMIKQSSSNIYRAPNALETMLWMNAYGVIFLTPLSYFSGQLSNGIRLVNGSFSIKEGDMSITTAMAILNVTAAVGQIFIFFTIQLFSPLMCTTITTTRKFITIILSVWNFGHRFSMFQWTSISFVFCGIYMAIGSEFVGSRKVKTQ